MGTYKKPIQRGGLPKKGGLDSLPIYGAAWQERGGGVFDGGIDTPMHTMARLREFTCVFYHTHVKNLLKGSKPNNNCSALVH